MDDEISADLEALGPGGLRALVAKLEARWVVVTPVDFAPAVVHDGILPGFDESPLSLLVSCASSTSALAVGGEAGAAARDARSPARRATEAGPRR